MILDTETSGLPPRLSNAWQDRWKQKPVHDTKAWECCRLVQIAWNMYTRTGAVVSKRNMTVYPDGFVIPKETSDIHGFTTERALKEGVPIYNIFEILAEDLIDTDYVVCHNVAFDEKIVSSELIRYNLRWLYTQWKNKPKHCTMLTNTLPGQKWPKLCDLYERLYGHQPVADLHRADEDIRVTADVFFRLYPDGKVKDFYEEKRI